MSIKCPECKGIGFHMGYGCPGFKPIKITCIVCDGKGDTDEGVFERIKKGNEMRKERLNRDQGLREEGKRLGISPIELSRRERGAKC